MKRNLFLLPVLLFTLFSCKMPNNSQEHKLIETVIVQGLIIDKTSAVIDKMGHYYLVVVYTYKNEKCEKTFEIPNTIFYEYNIGDTVNIVISGERIQLCI